MSKVILQVNFKYNVSKDDYEAAVKSLVSDFATVDGLRWKVWIINEDKSEAGGIYLFEDDSSLQAYLEGPLAASISSHPALADMSAKQFNVMAEVTAITRGPV